MSPFTKSPCFISLQILSKVMKLEIAPRATPSQLNKTSPPTLQSHFCDTLMTVLDLPLQEGTFEFGPTQSMTQNKFKAK